MIIEDIVDFVAHPLSKQTFIAQCRKTLDRNGVLVLSDFIKLFNIVLVQELHSHKLVSEANFPILKICSLQHVPVVAKL